MSKPIDKRHKEMKEWLGLSPRECRDPEKFDLIEHQELLNDYFDI